LGLRDIPASQGISQIGEVSTTLINLYETRNSYEGLHLWLVLCQWVRTTTAAW